MGNQCNHRDIDPETEATPEKLKITLTSTNDNKSPIEIIFGKHLNKKSVIQHRKSNIHAPLEKYAIEVKSLNKLSKNSKQVLKSLPKFNIKKSEEAYTNLKNTNDENSSSSSNSRHENIPIFDIKELGPFRYLLDNSTYKGGYLNRRREGVGISITEKGDIYQGSWYNDVPQGYGRYIQFNGDYYIGGIRDGYPNGEGKLVFFKTKISYEGEMRRGMKHGKGVEIYPNGSKYIGNFFFLTFFKADFLKIRKMEKVH